MMAAMTRCRFVKHTLSLSSLWLGALSPIVAVAWPAPLRVGDTVRAELPEGDPYESEVVFALAVREAGPILVLARSFEVDVAARVERLGPDGSATPIGLDEYGGVFPHEIRLAVDAQPGFTYRITVQAVEFTDCGRGFEISIQPGSPLEDRDVHQALESGGRFAATVPADMRQAAACRVQALLHASVLSRRKGYFREAEIKAEEALRIARADSPAGSLTVPSCLHNLGRAVALEGAYEQARGHLSAAISLYEDRLGTGHPLVARSLLHLALILQETGAYEEARPMLERALEIREARLGPSLAEVAQSLDSLGSLLQEEGAFAAARPLHERALSINEDRLGPKSIYAGVSVASLCQALRGLGAYDEAMPACERAVGIFEVALGLHHYFSAAAVTAMGELQWDLQRHAEARRLLETALASREIFFGSEHLLVAESCEALGRLLLEMGPRDDAEALLERALAIRQKRLGGEHPLVAATLQGLASLAARDGSLEESQAMGERALRILETRFGADSLAICPALVSLAGVLEQRGRQEEARALHERALRIREARLDPEHPDVADSLADLGTLLGGAGLPQDARPLLDRAVQSRKKRLGAAHPAVSQALAQLGAVLAELGDQAGALDAALEAREIDVRHARLVSSALEDREALRLVAPTMASDLAITLAARPDRAAGAVTRVWDAVVRSRAVVLDEMAARRRTGIQSANPELTHRRWVYAAASSRLAQVAVQGPGADPASHRDRLAFALMKQEEAARDLALKEKEAWPGPIVTSAETDLEAVRRELPDESALVAFVQYDPVTLSHAGGHLGPGPSAAAGEPSGRQQPAVYAAFILVPEADEPAFVPIGPAKRIDALVSSWREESSWGPLRQGRSDAQAITAYRRAGEALRRAIWDPLAARLGNARRVFVVPDGALHLVSLASLPVGTSKYAVETGPRIHYLSAERDLAAAKDRPAPGEGLVALGGAAFDDEGRFARLAPWNAETGAPGSRGTGPEPPAGEVATRTMRQPEPRGSAACILPPPGVASWYRFDLDAGDAAGNQDGALRNGARIVRMANGAGAVDLTPGGHEGPRATVELPGGSFSGLRSGSIEVRFLAILPKQPDARLALLASRSDTTGDHLEIGVTGRGELRILVTSRGEELLDLTTNAPVVAEGQWSHVVYATGPDGHAVYVNGAAAGVTYARGEAATRAFFADLAGDTRVGIGGGLSEGGPGAGASGFGGLVEEVAVYERALTAGEAARLSGAAKCGPACYEPPGGIVSWYPLDSDASDVVGGRHGSLEGGLAFTSRGAVAGAARFNFGPEHVRLPDGAFDDLSAGTIEGWIYLDVSGAVILSVSGKTDFSCLGVSVPLVDSRGVLRMTVAGDKYLVVETSHLLEAGRWHHIAYAAGTEGNRLFVDGVEAAPVRVDGDARRGAFLADVAGRQPTLIGRMDYRGWGTSSWSGLLDEVTIWSRALSPVEVAGIHAAGTSGKCRARGGAERPGAAPIQRAQLVAASPRQIGASEADRGRPFRGGLPGCPEFDRLRFSSLPASAQEVREVAELFDRVVSVGPAGASTPTQEAQLAGKDAVPGAGHPLVLEGSLATEAAFKALAPGRRILHLATHGFFLDGGCPAGGSSLRGVEGLVTGAPTSPPPPALAQPENPLRMAGLAFAGANHRDAADLTEEDGILTSEEIGAMDLSRVEWAVLSACDTGVGPIVSGEGVLGLRRAFQVAGTRTLIMSLWSLEDESARRWMKALYEARLLRGAATIDAVHEASLEILRERRRMGASVHPFFWAGFVAAGDWR